MGIVSALLEVGIVVEEAVGRVATRTGAVPLQWQAGQQTGSLISRLPRDPHQRASIFAKAQNIIVNEGETAVVLQDGKARGALDPGFYRFDRQRLVTALDVIWIKTGQQALKWGVGNVTSSDGIQVSANGMIYLRVQDGVVFNTEVVQGALLLAEVDLQRFLMPRIQGVLRSTIGRWGALNLQTQREMFTEAVRTNLSETFGKMGLAIIDLEVVEVGLPAEFKAAVSQATLAQHTGTASILQAQAAAQVAQLQAAATAQAQLTTGLAQAQLMAQLQSQGIDPLKMKALEALQSFAEAPSAGGGLISGDVAKAQLFAQMSMAALTQGPSVPLGPATAAASSARLPAMANANETLPTAEASAESPQDLERQLDALVERLAEGKITEDLFNKLSARLEGKLAKLRDA